MQLNRLLWLFGFMASCTFSFASQPQPKPELQPISHFPLSLDPHCGDGLAKLYDECGDQTKILQQALTSAQQQNKSVLIVYGAEWCIWCHVFEKYVAGQSRYYDYQWRADKELVQWQMQEDTLPQDLIEAVQLNHYVAQNFVLAHIEADHSNGKEVLKQIDMQEQIYAYPAILMLNKAGKYVASIQPSSLISGLEVRESGGQEYRGYNREILLSLLKQLKEKEK